jgi:LPS-assembly protein
MMNAIGHKKLNILNLDLTIAFLITIIIFISCPGASASETKNNDNPVNIKADSMNGDDLSDVSRVQGKITLIYKGPAPDAEDTGGDNKNNIAAAPGASAVETKNNGNPANIEADSMDYDNVRDVYHAQGKVNIIYSGATLYADDMELDNKNNIATAQGSASLKMGEDTLQGDKIVFNIEDKTGAVYKAHAFYARNHFYITGDKIEKTGENTYFIENPVATTCDGDNPDWKITGSEMKVTIEGYGLMKNAWLLARGLPVFYSPFLPFPAKTQRQSGFLVPYLSSSGNDGIDVEVPYFWAISPQMDATFYQRYIEKRGFKEGAEFRYYLGNNSSGTFYGDYMEDTKHVTETTDAATSRDWQEMHQRWSYYLNHQTDFDPQFYVRTDLRQVSDKWYFKDFSAHNYYLDHYSQTADDPFKKVPFQGDQTMRYLDSTIRVVKSWSNYNLTGLISSTDDFAAVNNDQTLQKYPEIVFTGIKQPFLKTPLYYEFAGTYDYFYRGEGQKGQYGDFSPTVSLPFNIFDYIKVIPQFALKETFWSRDDNLAGAESKSGDRTILNASLDLNSKLSRVFDVNVQNWEKIQHVIKSEITYSYVPNVSRDNLPDYYLPAFSPFVMPITSVGTIMPITSSSLDEQNAIAWSLTNTFIAKIRDEKGAYSYLEFLRLKLFQTYDLNEANKSMEGVIGERRPFSDLGMEFDFTPYKYFSFTARNLYSVYDGWTQTNYDLNLKDWRGDTLVLGYLYTLGSIEEINVNLKAVITPNIDGTFITAIDRYNSQTVGTTVGLIYHKQCWSMGLEYTQTATDSRVVFKISLAGLGKLL